VNGDEVAQKQKGVAKVELLVWVVDVVVNLVVRILEGGGGGGRRNAREVRPPRLISVGGSPRLDFNRIPSGCLACVVHFRNSKKYPDVSRADSLP